MYYATRNSSYLQLVTTLGIASNVSASWRRMVSLAGIISYQVPK